jgi:catechol 2,3-dioxygenase-like lactoylglutathione lyase family enzyme
VFDHVVFGVSDYAASRAFFVKVLAPLGVAVVSEGPLGIELCRPDSESSLCIRLKPERKPAHIHLAFTAANREQVESFYRAALSAGAKDNGAPGLRPQYHANYYAAFVIGPDGHNIEAVCHEPVWRSGSIMNPSVPAPVATPDADFFRALEVKRTQALVARDMPAIERLHASDYELVSPPGRVMTLERYLSLIAAEPFYAKWEHGAMRVRLSEGMAAVRYQARITFPSGLRRHGCRQTRHPHRGGSEA